MITVPEATKKIIERSRYLTEAISKGLINYSSLARYIKPELEEMLVKKVSNASIIMALTRLEADFAPKYTKGNIFKSPPEILVRSNLIYTTLSNKDTAGLSILFSRENNQRTFYFEIKGLNETTFILSQDIFEKYKSPINAKNPVMLIEKVSAISIYLPPDAIKTAGIYYFFIKSLAWEGINILAAVTNPSEFSIIVGDSDTQRAFGIIKSLFV